MTGKALICKLGTIEAINGADKIAQVKMFGETVIVSKDYTEGTVGLLFDCETELSHEFCSANNLYRHSNLNSDQTVKGYMEDNRRVRPIRLKGVRCSAMWMPLSSLYNLGIKVPNLEIGQEIGEIDDVKICSKYITQKTKSTKQNKEGKVKLNLTPTFKEHIDTDQWGRNTHKVQVGDLVVITEKLHGTSIRVANLQVIRTKSWFEKLLNRFGFKTLDTDYKFMVGSRRVVKSIDGNEAENKEHYYNEDLWTKIGNEQFRGKLRKGETVYAEIVGYTPDGQSIMGSHSNEKLKNFMSKDEYKEFINRYGETTEFTYGCSKPYVTDNGIIYDGINPYYKVFVYRITMTNEDGETVDYSWEQVKTRCEQMGVLHVPEIDKTLISLSLELLNIRDVQQYLEHVVEKYTESESENFPQHLNEGVVIRIENGSLIPQFYKSKRYLFKVLEGIIKDNPDNVDVEESN